jgi:DNA-binding transcriptional LysR family regulator
VEGAVGRGVPEAHPLPASSISLAELADLPLISIGEVSGPRQFESHLAFASAGLNPVSVFQTNQPQTLLSLVKHGLGTGVTNALAVATANLGCSAADLARRPCVKVHRMNWSTKSAPRPFAR